MSKENLEIMQRIIEEKKKKSAQQGGVGGSANKSKPNPNQGFNNKKRAGSLNK
ncbi:MAG: hypothetical protein KA953_04160 [Lachnospiraceae bacterium]|mgnify:CR=1 FL=1|nr:hypothetical protein [Lachnospiraceae bacterium]